MEFLLLGSGDAVIGINPATGKQMSECDRALKMLNGSQRKIRILMSLCALTHGTTKPFKKKHPLTWYFNQSVERKKQILVLG